MRDGLRCLSLSTIMSDVEVSAATVLSSMSQRCLYFSMALTIASPPGMPSLLSWAFSSRVPWSRLRTHRNLVRFVKGDVVVLQGNPKQEEDDLRTWKEFAFHSVPSTACISMHGQPESREILQ